MQGKMNEKWLDLPALVNLSNLVVKKQPRLPKLLI